MAFNLTADFTRAARIDTWKNLETFLENTFTKRFALSVPSDGPSERHEWLGDNPGVSEFLDTRSLNNLKTWNFTIFNRLWENTIAFTERELKNMPAMVKARIPSLAQSAAEHLDDLLFDVLVAGESGACFDGQYFFSTAHPTEDKGSFSNLLTGAGMSTAYVQTDWMKFETAIRGVKKRNGRPLFRDIGKPTILHAPTNAAIFREVFTLPTVSGGGANPYYNLATPIPLGDITGNSWYVLLEDKPMKPFVHQEREGWMFEWSENERFMKNKIYYGGKADYGIGYGHPALCYKIKNN